MAGAIAFLTRTLQVQHKSCLVCPGLSTSTSARSGAGWFLLPSTQDKHLLVSELTKHAAEHDVAFDAERASYFIEKTDETREFIEQVLGVQFDPVPSFDDPVISNCTEMPACCVNETRHVLNHGDFTCNESKQWYKQSKCCTTVNGTLNGFQTWPSYIHLKNSLRDRVTWITKGNSTNMNTASLIEMMVTRALQENSTFVQETVQDVQKWDPWWRLRLSNSQLIYTENIVFASGGFGAAATQEEYETLGIYSSNEVHAHNSGILWKLAKEENWTKDELNAWYLEFVENAPKWFLWDSEATTLSLDGDLIYDESASYDERGRIAKRRGVKEAYYVTYDPTSNKSVQSELGNTFSETLVQNGVKKSCDTRSKRLWRNYVANAYGEFVDKFDCSARVGPLTPVSIRRIRQGIIDTISGPVVNKYQRIIATEKAYACGNAASPGLFPTYLAPGSTLGNALVGGFIAGQNQ